MYAVGKCFAPTPRREHCPNVLWSDLVHRRSQAPTKFRVGGKHDKTGLPALSVEQLNAIDLLVLGKTDQDIAQQIGKTRQTVCNWRRYHPVFQAELNRQRAAIWGAAADRLRSLLPKAVEVLEHELEGVEHRLHVALALVKMADIAVNYCGLQEVEEVIQQVTKQRNLNAFSLLGSPVDTTRLGRELLEKAERGE